MDREAMLRRAREATDAWNRHDAAARRLPSLAEDATCARRRPAPEPTGAGRAIQAKRRRPYMTAFPDLHIEVLFSPRATASRVVQEWVGHRHLRGAGSLTPGKPTHRQAPAPRAAPSRRFGVGRASGPSRRCTGARWRCSCSSARCRIPAAAHA